MQTTRETPARALAKRPEETPARTPAKRPEETPACALAKPLEETPQPPVFSVLSAFGPRALANLLIGIHARQELLGKIARRPGAFAIHADLVSLLRAARPRLASELDALLREHARLVTGIVPHRGLLLYLGFPARCTVHERAAYQSLVDHLAARAQRQRWAKSTLPPVFSERYAARTWLNSLGMTGPAHRSTRELLLRPLSGDSAFRLPCQRSFHLARKQRAREARLLYEREHEFVLL